MQSVTQRVKYVKQPYGGYVRIRDFEKSSIDDIELLGEKENINASLVGAGGGLPDKVPYNWKRHGCI